MLLASFCDNAPTHQGFVCCWVTAPEQSNAWVTVSVAVSADVPWTVLNAAFCLCFFPLLPEVLTTFPAPLDACLDGKPPFAAVHSFSFSSCWVDVACLQIWHPCIAFLYVWNHVAIKLPVEPFLGKQARYTFILVLTVSMELNLRTLQWGIPWTNGWCNKVLTAAQLGWRAYENTRAVL